MSVKTEAEFKKLKIIGRIVRKTLDQMAAAARSGMTTAELDGLGRKHLMEAGAEPAPAKVYGFPGAVCISVNDEAVHGVPGNRVLQDGDLLKLDLVACKDGFFADAAVSVPIAYRFTKDHVLLVPQSRQRINSGRSPCRRIASENRGA